MTTLLTELFRHRTFRSAPDSRSAPELPAPDAGALESEPPLALRRLQEMLRLDASRETSEIEDPSLPEGDVPITPTGGEEETDATYKHAV